MITVDLPYQNMNSSKASKMNNSTVAVQTPQDATSFEEEIRQRMMEKYQKKHHEEEDKDWRDMTEEEWKKLLDKIDNDIELMREHLEEEEEEAKAKQLEEALKDGVAENM